MSRDQRTTNLDSLQDLFTRAWYKYDKNITSVLRTLGFNTVKQYIDSNQKAQNFYRIIDQLKSQPKDGIAGVYKAMKDLSRSNEFRTILWIEDNVEKWQLVKEKNEPISKLSRGIRGYIKTLKDIPGVINLTTEYVHISNFENNSISGEKDAYFLKIKISYDPTILYIPEDGNPYQIFITGDFTQVINIPIKRIDLQTLRTGTTHEIMQEMITPKALRDAFVFRGPSMFTNTRGRNDRAAGCLGNRGEEFNEITEESNLHRYISFVTDWGRNYVSGRTGPYRSPGELIRTQKVDGFTDINTPQSVARVQDCNINGLRTRDFTPQKNYLKRLGVTSLANVCTNCVISADDCTWKEHIPVKPNPTSADLMDIASAILKASLQETQTEGYCNDELHLGINNFKDLEKNGYSAVSALTKGVHFTEDNKKELEGILALLRERTNEDTCKITIF